jgi:hypothetical protein
MRVFLASPSDEQPRCLSEIARRQALPITNENGRSAIYGAPHVSVGLMHGGVAAAGGGGRRARGHEKVPTCGHEEVPSLGLI